MTRRPAHLLCLCLLAGLVGPAAARADEPVEEPQGTHGHLAGAADFAPLGVVLDHTHRKGDWTVSYRFTRARDEGLRDGTSTSTAGEVLARGYASVPVSARTDSHLFTLMYAPVDRLTVAVALPYLERSIETESSGGRGTLRARGIGDAQLLFLVPFMQKGSEKTHVNLGLGLPTGSIRETDSQGSRLPYSLQPGAGSWDALWGLTYMGHYERLSWGAQFEGTYRIADNDVGYRQSTVYHASTWCAGSWSDWLSASLRLAWTRKGNVRGVDPSLDKTLSPLNDNKMQGGTRLDLGPGLNVFVPILGGQRLAVELLWPVYQNLDGPQLDADATIIAGWQWVF